MVAELLSPLTCFSTAKRRSSQSVRGDGQKQTPSDRRSRLTIKQRKTKSEDGFGLPRRREDRHPDLLVAIRVDFESGVVSLAVELALPPFPVEAQLLLLADVLGNEMRQPCCFFGFSLLALEPFTQLALFRSLWGLEGGESLAGCFSREKRGAPSLTYLGLLFSALSPLVFEARLTTAHGIDMPFGDVGRGARAQVVQHLFAELMRRLAL